jgi:hypothetical protein
MQKKHDKDEGYLRRGCQCCTYWFWEIVSDGGGSAKRGWGWWWSTVEAVGDEEVALGSV